MNYKRLIIIGGGAAGFFCAVNAAVANPALQITLLEKSSKWLSKVRISGGGRCNVTHACFSISEMIRKYPRGQNFLKQAFHHFFTKDTIEWFEKKGVKLKTEADGRMFPVTDSSETIIQCLLYETDKHKVVIHLNRDVKEVKQVRNEESNFFEVHLSNSTFLTADYVCIACGGFPKSTQYQWLESLGHTISTPVPSLFTFNVQESTIQSLMGISVENVKVKIKGTTLSQSGAVLITHWGFSGPAILKLSAYAARELAGLHYDFTISINWLGETNENALLEKLKIIRNESARKKISNKNPFNLPNRLWEYLAKESGINTEWNWADLPAKQQNVLAKTLCAQEFHVKGKTTFKEEFVTAGGISLQEISPSTMQSKIVPNLYFAGEIMDVDGITGGFNFQHAWTSGYIAAKSIVTASLQ